jgi:hypothetical protein
VFLTCRKIVGVRQPILPEAALNLPQNGRTLATASHFHKAKYLKNQSFAYTIGEIVVSLRTFPRRFRNILK